MLVFKNTKWSSICLHCGTVFRVRPVDMRKGKGIFCTRKCKELGLGPYKDGGWKARRLAARKADRSRDRVHQKVLRAVKSGKLEKGPCAVCGTTDRIEAHHEDYSKPLEVIWLCKRHHFELHHPNAFEPLKINP